MTTPFLSVPIFYYPGAVSGQLSTYIANTTTPQVTYSDAAGTVPNTNPVILDTTGAAIVRLGAGLAYDFVLKDQTGTTTLWTASNYIQPLYSVSLTQAILAALLIPQTSGESAAGVTPTNFQYAVGYVDRYGTNTTPGTTGMDSAFNSAILVAAKLGCSVRWGATAPYRLNNPVNATVQRGIVFNDESSANLSANVPSIIVGHTGHAFDIAGSVELTFNNLVVQNVTGTVPSTIWFTGRIASAACGLHRFNNCRTAFAHKSNWVFYGVGSEENFWNGCTFYQNQASSGIFSHNVSNPSSLTSTFVTIGAGVSGTENHHSGFGYYNLANGGSNLETVFQLDQASNTTIRDGTWGNAHGLAHISIVGAGAITNLVLDGVRGEPLGTTGLHGILVANTAGTNLQWTINNVTVDTSGYLLNFKLAQTPSIQNLTVQASTSTSGFGVLAYSMSNSEIQLLGGNTLVGQAGGTVSNNIFKMWRSQASFSGTASSNTFIDNNTGTIVTQAIGLNNSTAPGQSTGWGTPANGAVIASYNATTEGNTNTTKAVAQIITYLKSQGAFGA